ncbi:MULTISPECIES: SurA N-terminal domain-containing protein [unclassified Streptomyces]|uniref:SurA N-terminal domain-containing protein n=1 Tax=unclassified Streptomyces TaxID=2593676 RepID=UPI0019040DB9|nr:SurA N-terminal domain-containing protein [Streptomyces sp. HSG2]
MPRRRTATLWATALAASASLLTACGGQAHPGAAAVVGGERITVAELEERVGEVREARRAAVSDDAQYRQAVARTGGLARDTLHGMVLDRVLHHAAQREGVSVGRKEVQAMREGLEQRTGGARALETVWLEQYGVSAARLDENLGLQLEAQKLAERLGTDTGQPAFWEALSEASRDLAVDLNPRYGSWDMEHSGRVDTETPWVRDTGWAAGLRPV